MLNPKTDLIDFGQQLIPSEGYEFSFAAGTTYSLDLEALMIIPVALFYSKLLDTTRDNFRPDLLDSITRISNKIIVFCQKGKIKVPKEYHFLLAYWEKGIEEVMMSHKAQSFHPKVWIIRYDKEGEAPLYKVIVTSRNLTYNRDWDVIFTSEGKVGTEKNKKSEQLVHFFRHISSLTGRIIPEDILKDLSCVDFELPDGYNLLNFHPIGITAPGSKDDTVNPLSKKSWEDLLVISPFVQDETIKSLREKTERNLWLLSRKEEIDSLSEDALEYVEPYQFSQYIQQGEFRIDEEEGKSEAMMQNLHAKLFVGLRNGYSHWYIGSANATDPAFGRNIEFMVELKGENGEQRPRRLLNQLTKEGKNEIILFEEYDFNNRTDQEKRKKNEIILRDIIYELTKLKIEGTADYIESTKLYNLVLNVDARRLSIPEGYSAALLPLPIKDRKPVSIKAGEINIVEEFDGLTEIQLSPFFIWEISDSEGMLKQFLIQIDIPLPSTRLNKIFTSIINSRDKFIKFIVFLLTGEENSDIGDNSLKNKDKEKAGDNNTWNEFEFPIFEKLMIAASRHPARLKSINNLIEKMKLEKGDDCESIIPKEFELFWSTFLTFLERIS